MRLGAIVAVFLRCLSALMPSQRLISMCLMVVLCAQSALAMPQGYVSIAAEIQSNVGFWWFNSGWAKTFARWFPQQTKAADTKGWDGKGAPPNTPPDPKEQEKQSDRDGKVQRIEIAPRDVTIATGEKVIFTAVAFDKSGNMIPGVKFTWDGADEDKARKLSVSPRGEFSSPIAGNYKVTVEALNKKDSVKVTVIGDQINPKDPGEKGDAVSSQDAPKLKKIGLRTAPSAPQEAAPLRKVAGDKLAQLTHKATRAATTTVAAVQGGSYDYYQWNSTNYTTADDPGREVGQMPGHAVDGGAGSGNFQFSAPLLALDGRGIDVNLAMNYNARLWHKNGTDMYFDIDNDYIPGWTFGFGKIITAGSGFMLEDADGTRHSYGGNTWSYPSPNSALQGFDGYTKDGSFINYYARGYKPQFNSTIVEAWAKLPNGTKIVYGASTKLTAYPTQITDANGNYITIAYVNNQGPQINYITDTLGRVINFKYVDVWVGNGYKKLLVAVTAPGFNGGADRVVAQFAYDTANLGAAGANYGFSSSVTPRVSNPTIARLKAIYYPATNTGYWFGDADSYSNYGMIRKISERRAMVCSNPNDTTAQANITSSGNMSREIVYSSGTTPGFSSATGYLTDVPTYTTMTEDWAGRQAGIAPPVTEYSVATTSATTTTQITRDVPNTTDGITNVQITDNNAASPTYGLLLEDYTLPNKGAAYAAALHHSKVYWEVPDLNQYPSHYGAPRPNHTEVTDERGQTTTTTYNYGINYNQVADVREYGYNGQLLRRTHTDYINTTNYIGSWYNNAYGSYFGRHIYSLPSVVEVYGSDDTTRVARTEYQYDSVGLLDTPSVTMHETAFNPYDSGYTCYIQVWNPDTYQYDYVESTCYSYDASTDARGNVTNVKRYADALNVPSDPKAMVETRSYDICGNLRTASTSCCEQTSFNYTLATNYTWPSSVTRGSASDPSQQNTTSTVYDNNTGLVTTAYDANGRWSTMTYNTTTLRPVFEYAPRYTSGQQVAYAYHEYYDDLMAVVDFVYEANTSGGTWANRVDKYLDGHGRVSEEIGFTIGYDMDVVDTVYDQWGRVQKQTRPYRRYANWTNAETPQWTNYNYDTQDRVSSVVAPDGSTTYRYYNEASYPSAASSPTAKGTTIRVKDAWGRERWARSDEQNRLVEVVEPNPTGDGTVANSGLLTTYAYNTLGNLTNVYQGAQERKFKYDSLGRLTNQKLAERDATLNDSGGAGTAWSDYFQYDNRGNLTQRIDARFVQTNFNYGSDPFNRLLSVEYIKTAAPNAANIPDAGKVTYGYETTPGKDKTRLLSISVAAVNGLPANFGDQSFTYHTTDEYLSRVTQNYGNSRSVNVDYELDSLDRIKKIKYPAAASGAIREAVPTYDMVSRLKDLTYNGTLMATNPLYNAASQTTQLDVGSMMQEQYNFDPQTGLLTNQKVVDKTLSPTNPLYGKVDLTYDYANQTVGASNPTWKTGQLSKLTDNKNTARNRQYLYDKLGRLTNANGGASFNTWGQLYSYDRYGNRTGVVKTGGNGANNAVIDPDGMNGMTYNAATNRITTSTDFTYDEAGNLTKSNENGQVNTYKYDAAGRLAEVGNSFGTHTYAYGANNQRLQLVEQGAGGATTLYAWDGGSVIAEYNGAGSGMVWTKSYVYLGGRLLATDSTGGVQYHHPDRLGTRLVTNAAGSVVSENINLPFGNTINGESNNLAGSASKKRFTSYDRSDTTKLDYAVNRHYSAAQGRFTQVDPIGMRATSLNDPQSLNLFAYCGNDPVNQLDPDGLFSLKSIFGIIGKAFKWVFRVAAVLVAVLAVVALNSIGQYWGAILITKGLVAALFASSALLAVAGWAPGRVGQLAAALITGGLGGGGNFRTPPINGAAGVSGVNSFLATQNDPLAKSPNSPNSFGYFSALADSNFAIALGAAEKALQNSDCRALITGFAGGDPRELFTKLRRKGQIGIGSTPNKGETQVVNNPNGSGFGKGLKARIIIDRRFLYEDGLATSSLAGISDPAIGRATTILHELAHATGALQAYHNGKFAGRDLGTENQFDKVNEIISKTCFSNK